VNFARRLYLITALQVSAVLCLLVLSGSLFAFGSYIATVRGDLVNTIGWLNVALDGTSASHDAERAAEVAASHYVRADIVVMIFDQHRRVDVYKQHRTDPMPVVQVSTRSMPLPGSQTTAPFAHVILGLATAFGLQAERARVGSVDIIVRESDGALSSATQSFLPTFFASLVAAVLLGFVIARFLTQQALRPLMDVTEALERFAAGDLSPQLIAADRRHQLARLTVAYNGAIEQMERAFAERERASASMRQFIADAGHQLRTPLTVLRGFIAILRKGDLRTPEDRDRILETMNRQSQIMGSLIEKLMLLERWEESRDVPVPEAIDVGRFVDDVVSPIAEAQPARVVRVHAEHGPLVAIDPSDLRHALANLVDNALKYTSGAIDVTVKSGARYVSIEIADEGPGMTADEVGHAFDRFFRGNRRDIDGSGLGLAIARRAVERAGGTLSLTSAPDRGTVFTIVLPAIGIRPKQPYVRHPAPV
jgi:signal transduction histidine kinase